MLGDQFADVETDRHGYATAHLAATGMLPGWHGRYHVVTIPDNSDESRGSQSGRFNSDPAAPFAVVSDIDDTVLRTGLTEGLVASARLCWAAPPRREIPGMPLLYQVWQPAPARSPEPSFYYLSRDPGTCTTSLPEFLEIRGFPRGPSSHRLGPTGAVYVMRSGKEHKRLSLARMFSAYPKTKFVLIGDSGQNDPYVYVEAAREHPRQVRAIIIIDVGDHMPERAQELREWQQRLEAEKIPTSCRTQQRPPRSSSRTE